MEADWTVEIGGDHPNIDAGWEGLVDLRSSPVAVDTIPEAQHPALRRALLSLNANDSAIFTTKCDVWEITNEEVDPDEFSASRKDADAGFASYIDILEADRAHFASFDYHEERMRNLTLHLREVPMDNCRVDLVLRSAVMNEKQGFGITLYAAGCGANATAAYAAWEAVLAAAVAATIKAVHPCMGE
jgi:hypothetical protein